MDKQIIENEEVFKPSKPHFPLLNEEIDDQSSKKPEKELSIMYEKEALWSISFDDSCGKTSLRASIWIHNTNEAHSFRLEFQCTNNIAEYEALLLGLHILKDLGAKKMSAQGDSELVIRQIKGEYLEKKPKTERIQECGIRHPQNLQKI